MRYQKRPIVVEAFQMTAERRWSNVDWPDWLHEAWNKDHCEGALWPDPDNKNRLVLGTKEGVCKLQPACWIIKGINGELYPCDPDIFETTYDLVEEMVKELYELREKLNQDKRMQPTVGQAELNADAIQRLADLLIEHLVHLDDDRPPGAGIT
jgi:hypothetical protein